VNAPGKRRGGGSRSGAPAPWPSPRVEGALATLLVLAYVALAAWGIARQSVTFDENFHVPAGVVAVSRGDPGISAVNPPLVKWLFGAAALLAGAEPPSDTAIATRDQAAVGESFMRTNAARYHRVFSAARLVSLLFGVALGLLVRRAARAFWGARGGLLALVLWVLAPEALAHAGVATLDMATALGWTWTALALARFFASGAWRDWAVLALAVAFLTVTRFTSLLVVPLALALLASAAVTRSLASPRRALAGLLLLVPVAWLALQAAYAGHTSWQPLASWTFRSRRFLELQHAWPSGRLPLPDDYVRGLDRQAFDSEAGHLTTYLLGRAIGASIWWYFPFALLCKLPLGLLAAAAARGVHGLMRGARRPDATLLVAILVFMLPAMFLSNLNAGVRYMLPVLPLLAIACGGLATSTPAPATAARRGRVFAWIGLACALGLAVEVVPAGPDWLAFFNRAAGGPGGGERLLNDSNVDWGQGLIELRDELHRRGIERVTLAYHGTTDPAVYGIDYVPYRGGLIGAHGDWFAVSSYFFVGLPQRMMTREGYTPVVVFDFRTLWPLAPAAHPAGCMWLFRVP